MYKILDKINVKGRPYYQQVMIMGVVCVIVGKTLMAPLFVGKFLVDHGLFPF